MPKDISKTGNSFDELLQNGACAGGCSTILINTASTAG
jgi:hypothetical protein